MSYLKFAFKFSANKTHLLIYFTYLGQLISYRFKKVLFRSVLPNHYSSAASAKVQGNLFIDFGSSTRNRVPRFVIFDDTLNLGPNLYPKIIRYVTDSAGAASFLNLVPYLYPNLPKSDFCKRKKLFPIFFYLRFNS